MDDGSVVECAILTIYEAGGKDLYISGVTVSKSQDDFISDVGIESKNKVKQEELQLQIANNVKTLNEEEPFYEKYIIAGALAAGGIYIINKGK